MDKFNLSLHYIKGKKNVLANCFTQLPIFERSVPVGDNTDTNRWKKPEPESLAPIGAEGITITQMQRITYSLAML